MTEFTDVFPKHTWWATEIQRVQTTDCDRACCTHMYWVLCTFAPNLLTVSLGSTLVDLCRCNLAFQIKHSNRIFSGVFSARLHFITIQSTATFFATFTSPCFLVSIISKSLKTSTKVLKKSRHKMRHSGCNVKDVSSRSPKTNYLIDLVTSS